MNHDTELTDLERRKKEREENCIEEFNPTELQLQLCNCKLT